MYALCLFISNRLVATTFHKSIFFGFNVHLNTDKLPWTHR